MRQLGTLPTQEQTRKFVDYLLTEGIATRAEQDGDVWLIWVVQEDDFEKSKADFDIFLESPDDERFQGKSEKAEEIRAKKRARVLQARKNLKVVRAGSREKLLDKAKRIPVTFGLTVICIVVAFWTFLGSNVQRTDPLMFVSHRHEMQDGWRFDHPSDAMVDVKSGQYWRLLTPVIVHLGPLHLIFNMMWLHQLGGQVETRKGWLKYVLMMLALAIFSNLVQVYISKYPFFGGMSGVVYGLFGYVWIKSRFDPSAGFYIDPGTVRLMLIWFVICFLPILNVANGGHAGGLILGALMGYLSSTMR